MAIDGDIVVLGLELVMVELEVGLDMLELDIPDMLEGAVVEVDAPADEVVAGLVDGVDELHAAAATATATRLGTSKRWREDVVMVTPVVSVVLAAASCVRAADPRTRWPGRRSHPSERCRRPLRGASPGADGSRAPVSAPLDHRTHRAARIRTSSVRIRALRCVRWGNRAGKRERRGDPKVTKSLSAGYQRLL